MRLALGDGVGLHLCSYLGLPNWHVRPRGLGCPFGAGACCWLRWGQIVDGEQQPIHGLPVKLLEGLATLAALAAEAWAAPARRAWPHLTAFNFGTEQCLTASSIWAGDLLACVDGARDAGRWWVGALVPFLGVRSFCPPPRRHESQQTMELHAVAWAVHLAVRLGLSSVTICSDSEPSLSTVIVK